MSGHSKWAQIKHKKAAADAKKGQHFTRFAKLISMAARDGADPTMNFKLRLAIDRAREINMPKDSIERAIARGAGTGNEAALESITYEGYGPSGVAVLVETVTDNRNRTSADVRHTFDKYGGKMGTSGSVQWMFSRVGILTVRLAEAQKSEEEIELFAIDAGAQDVKADDGAVRIIVAPEELEVTREKCVTANIPVADTVISYLAKNTVELSDSDQEKLATLVAAFEESDDVSNVYTNFVDAQ